MDNEDARNGADRSLSEKSAPALNKFTYNEYRHILFSLEKAGYKFLPLGATGPPPVCYLRHDIDVSVEKALAMARLERDMSVSSTYCVMFRTNSYNIFSQENTNRMREILKLGHHLGLHFDASGYGQQSLEELRAACLWEAKILSDWFFEEVSMISFHKPDAMILSGLGEITKPLPHAYETRFIRNMTYLADSFGFWRYGHPLEHKTFADRESLTLCAHPIWWNDRCVSPLYALKQSMTCRREEIREYMLTNIVGV